MLIEFIKPDFEFADERGTLKQLVHANWKQVNYITSVAGAFRGNHYHKQNIEAFFVISGAFKLFVESLDGTTHEEYMMKPGDFFIVRPFINHSFEYIQNTQLISFYDKGVENSDGTKDIFVSEERVNTKITQCKDLK